MIHFEEQLSAEQKQMLICTLVIYKITKTQNENKINTYNKNNKNRKKNKNKYI
jgi:hypothetical protein